MMAISRLIQNLRNHLSPQNLPIIARTIRREPLIWQMLLDEEFFQRLPPSEYNNLTTWTPGNLALLSLNVGLNPTDVRAQPLTPLASDLRQQAVRVYDEYRQAAEPTITTLAQAALIALALRERARILGTWENLSQELPVRNSSGTKLILACAYDYLSEPDAYLREYCQESKQLSLCAGAIFLQPLKREKQARLIAALASSVRSSERLTLLRQLEKDQPADARTLAVELLQVENQPVQSEPSPVNVLWSIPEKMYLSEVRRLAGKPDQAVGAYEQLDHDIQQLQQEVVYKLLDEAITNNQIEIIDRTLQHADRMTRISAEQQATLAFRLFQGGQHERAESLLNAAGETTSALILRSRYSAEQLSLTERLSLLLQAIRSWSCDRQTQTSLLLEAGQSLLELGRPDQALQLARYLTECLPEDPAAYLLLARSSRQHGTLEMAVEAAYLAAALAPGLDPVRRELIAALEASGSWTQAYEEWKSLFQFATTDWEREISNRLLSGQQRQDMRAFSLAAAHSGATEEALQICWKLLDSQPDDGLTHLILGQIFEVLGESELFIEHYIRANQLIPDHPETWLKLAEAYTATGNLAAAENTLKTAIQAIPDDARLYLMLGELYHRQDQPTQALNVLQKAAKIENLDSDQSALPATDGSDPSARYLSPLAGKITLLLGPTLLQLGHSDRAVEVLHNAYQTKEHKQAAAHQYARALIAVGKEQQALSALSIAYQSDPESQALSIEYARLLLKLGEQSEVAVAILSKQIEAGYTDVELLGLLAEALAGSADFHSALTYYQKAMETQLMGDPHWSIRLALGLSQVALETNNPNLAIAALQDAIQQAPDHLVLHQKLAEACFAAGLKEDALQLARQAYRLSPANIDNIIWYAGHCQQFDHREQAYEALQEAIELFPNHIELYLKAAEIEAKTNRTEAALQHFQTAADMPEISLEQLHIAASGLLELGNAEACIRCLERVQLVIHEDYNELSHRLLILLASAYDRLGENETALELIEKALYHQPVSAALLKQKAIIHLRLHQFKAAKACLQQVAKNEPHDPEVHRLLMQTEEAEGNFSAALDHARNGLAFAPPDQFRRAVLDAARLAWNLFQDQDTAQFLASFAASPQEREPQLTSHLHRVITALIAIDGHNLALISELNQANNGHQRTAPADIAIAALDDTLHGEVASARGLLLQLLSCDSDSLPPTPLVLGLAFETALRLLDFDMALEIAQRWQSAEPHNPRAYLAELRTCTEQAERKGFLADVGVTGRWASEAWNENRLREKIDKSKAKLLSLFGYPDVDSADLTAYTPLFPELVRRWITRSTAVFMDPSDLQQPEEVKHLLQEMARLAPDPGNTAAYIAAARRLGLSTQAVRVAKEYPNQSNVLAQLALCNLNIDPSAAMAAALNAMELAVSSSEQTHLPVYHALIARAAASAENYPQAYQALSNALAEWPDEPGWHIQAAEYARLTNDMAACIQHLEKAVAIDPDSDTVRRQLARSYQDAGALSRAAETYQKLCDNHPQDIDCWLEFAELQYQRGEIDAAAAFAEKALALGTTDPETILFTAQLQYSAENYPRAQELAGRLIEVEPENSSAAYLLARSLSAANRKEAALEVLDRALRYADRPLDLYLERIRLIRALHGLQPAFQSLQALDRQHPDHPGILALLAEYEQALGMVAEALATAQRALQLGQEVFKPQEASRLHALIGRIYRRTGQLDQALHQFSLAVSLYPTRIEYYLELGKTYQDRRQIEDALKIYEDAIQIAPQDPRPYQQAGQALKECKDYLGAEKMIRQAAELSPHDISIHRLLGSLVALNLVHNS